MKCDETNAFGLHEYKRQDIFLDATDEVRDADRFYIMIEADEVIAGLRKENEDLKNELFAVKTDAAMATRWRKCSDEMPEDDTEILATDGDEIWLCYKTTMCDGSPWFQPSGLPHIEGITHWMPLPKAPEVDKIEKEKDPVLKIVQEWMDISGFPKAQ